MHINKNKILFLETYNDDPYFNMAADEYFLELCENNTINGILRFYTWKRLCISIGYFFKKKHLNLINIKNDNILLVRRITGGNLIFHNNDFTYSLILKNGACNVCNKKDFYYFIGNLLQDSLKKLNIEAKINKTLKNINTPFCFDSVSQYEISTSDGKKIIGSAQKILKSALLQHGSFFYKKNANYSKYLNFEYNNDNQFFSEYLNMNKIIKTFKETFSNKLNLITYKLSNNDKMKIHDLIDSKYSKDNWNLRK